MCLLNDPELRTIGVTRKNYDAVCEQAGVLLQSYPIIEMNVPPDGVDAFVEQVVLPVLRDISEGRSVLVHCRGGIGRAGLVAACVMGCLA